MGKRFKTKLNSSAPISKLGCDRFVIENYSSSVVEFVRQYEYGGKAGECLANSRV